MHVGNTYTCDKLKLCKNKRMINNIVVLLDGWRLRNGKSEEHTGNIHQLNGNILVFVLDSKFMSVYYITNKWINLKNFKQSHTWANESYWKPRLSMMRVCHEPRIIINLNYLSEVQNRRTWSWWKRRGETPKLLLKWFNERLQVPLVKGVVLLISF